MKKILLTLLMITSLFALSDEDQLTLDTNNEKATKFLDLVSDLSNCSDLKISDMTDLTNETLINSSKKNSLKDYIDLCSNELSLKKDMSTITKMISTEDSETICKSTEYDNLKNNTEEVSEKTAEDISDIMDMCKSYYDAVAEQEKVKKCDSNEEMKKIFTSSNTSSQKKTYDDCDNLHDIGSLQDVKDFFSGKALPSDNSKYNVPSEPSVDFTSRNTEKAQLIKAQYLIALRYQYLPVVQKDDTKTISLGNRGTNGVFLGDNVNFSNKNIATAFTVDSSSILLKDFNENVNRYTSSYANKKASLLSTEDSLKIYQKRYEGYKKLLSTNFSQKPKQQVFNSSSANITIKGYNTLMKVINRIYNYVPLGISSSDRNRLQGGIISPNYLADLYNNYERDSNARKEFKKIVGLKKEDLPVLKIESEFVSGYTQKIPYQGLKREIWSTGVYQGRFPSSVGEWKNGEFFPYKKPKISDIQTTFNYGGHISGWGSNRNDFWKLTGGLDIEKSGNYCFRGYIDDGLILWVNNKKIINDWGKGHGAKYLYGCTNLKNGVNPIRLQFYDHGGKFQLSLHWKPFYQDSYTDIPTRTLLSNNSPICGSKYYIKDTNSGNCIVDKSKWEKLILSANNSSDMKNIETSSNTDKVQTGSVNISDMNLQIGRVSTILSPKNIKEFKIIDLHSNSTGSNSVSGTLYKIDKSETYKKCLSNNSITFSGSDINDYINIYITDSENYDSLKQTTKDSLLDSLLEEANNRLGNYLTDTAKSNFEKSITDNFKQYNNNLPDNFQYSAYAKDIKENNNDTYAEIYKIKFNFIDYDNEKYNDFSSQDIFKDYALGQKFNKLILLNPELKDSSSSINIGSDSCKVNLNNIISFVNTGSNKSDFENVNKYIFRFSDYIDFEKMKNKDIGNITIYLTEQDNCKKTKEKVISSSEFFDLIKPWIDPYYEFNNISFTEKSEKTEETKIFDSFIVNGNGFLSDYEITLKSYVDFNSELEKNLQPAINNIEKVCNSFLNFSKDNDKIIRNRLDSYSNLTNDIVKRKYNFGSSLFSGYGQKVKQMTLNATKKIKLKTFGIKLHWSPSKNFCYKNIMNGKFYISGSSVKSTTISFASKLDKLIKSKVGKSKSNDSMLKFADEYGYLNFKRDLALAIYWNDNILREQVIQEFLDTHNYSSLLNNLSIKLDSRSITSKGLKNQTFSTINMAVKDSCEDHKMFFGWKSMANFSIKSINLGRGDVAKVVNDLRMDFMNDIIGEIDYGEYVQCINDLQSKNEHKMYIKNFNLNSLRDSYSLKHLVKPNSDSYYVVASNKGHYPKQKGNTWADINTFKSGLTLYNDTHKSDFCKNVFKKFKKVKDSDMPKSMSSMVGYSAGNLYYNKYYSYSPTKDIFFRENYFQPRACEYQLGMDSEGNSVCMKNNIKVDPKLPSNGVNRADISILVKDINNKHKVYLSFEVFDIKKFLLNNDSGFSKSEYGSFNLTSDLTEVGNYDTKTEIDQIEEQCLNFKKEYELQEVMNFKTGKLETQKVYINQDKDFVFKYKDHSSSVSNCSEIKYKAAETDYNQNINCSQNVSAAEQAFNSMDSLIDSDQDINKFMDSQLSDSTNSLNSFIKQAQTNGGTRKFEDGKTTVSLTNDDSERITSLDLANSSKFEGDTSDMKSWDLNSKLTLGSTNSSFHSDSTADFSDKYNNIKKQTNDIDKQTSGFSSDAYNSDTFLGESIKGKDIGEAKTTYNSRFSGKIDLKKDCKDCVDRDKQYKLATSSFEKYKKSNKVDFSGKEDKQVSIADKAKNSQYQVDYKPSEFSKGEFSSLYKEDKNGNLTFNKKSALQQSSSNY